MIDLIKVLEEHGKGVRAYIKCMQIASNRLKQTSDEAAAYFMLKYAAGKFVHAFDDQPLLSSRAEEEFHVFKRYVEQLSEIETSSDGVANFGILNRVATEIANHKLVQSSV